MGTGKGIFFDFCYKSYNAELSDAEGIYTRLSLILGILVVLGGAIAKVALSVKYAHIPCICKIALVVFLLFCSILYILSYYYTIKSIKQQKYSCLKVLPEWKRYRDELARHVSQSREMQDDSDDLVLESIVGKLAEAQGKNASINEMRRVYVEMAILKLSYAAACFLGVAFLYISFVYYFE